MFTGTDEDFKELFKRLNMQAQFLPSPTVWYMDSGEEVPSLNIWETVNKLPLHFPGAHMAPPSVLAQIRSVQFSQMQRVSRGVEVPPVPDIKTARAAYISSIDDWITGTGIREIFPELKDKVFNGQVEIGEYRDSDKKR